MNSCSLWRRLELIQESGKDTGINFEKGTNEAGNALNTFTGHAWNFEG